MLNLRIGCNFYNYNKLSRNSFVYKYDRAGQLMHNRLPW